MHSKIKFFKKNNFLSMILITFSLFGYGNFPKKNINNIRNVVPPVFKDYSWKPKTNYFVSSNYIGKDDLINLNKKISIIRNKDEMVYSTTNSKNDFEGIESKKLFLVWSENYKSRFSKFLDFQNSKFNSKINKVRNLQIIKI